jgi:hypothetical protein
MTDTIELDDETTLALAATRARRSLNNAPGLIAYARSLSLPSLGVMGDGTPRATSKGAPLPFRADAIDDTDDAYARLIQWVTYWSEQLDVAPPATVVVVWRRDGQEQGFRAEATPAGAGQLVQILVTWMLIRWDAILADDAASVFVEDVNDIFRTLFGKYPRAPRRERQVLPLPCPVCDHFAFGAEWQSENVEDFVLRCEHCDHKEPAATYLATEKGVRKLMVLLREERQVWDREGVLAFYDEHGYYPSEQEPLDKRRAVPACAVTAMVDGRPAVCGRRLGHDGVHRSIRTGGVAEWVSSSASSGGADG